MGRAKNKGFFVAIEGIDGSGKSTQAKKLGEWLKKQGMRVALTQEPSDLPTGRLVQKILDKKIVAGKNTLALLFAADRLQHTQLEIKPLLKKGYVVISDRYVLSSLAYQSAAGVPLSWVGEINKKSLKPDLTIVIDHEPVECQKRLTSKEIFDEQVFQKKVRENYLKLGRELGAAIISGSGTKQVVEERIRDVVGTHLSGGKTRRRGKSSTKKPGNNRAYRKTNLEGNPRRPHPKRKNGPLGHKPR